MAKNILILFGGPSPEHEISVKTAYNVACSIDETLFNPIFIGITRTGHCKRVVKSELETLSSNHQQVHEDFPTVFLKKTKSGAVVKCENENTLYILDAALPLLHGTFGEDGTIQGLLTFLNIPYVGNTIKSSAVCMDKDFTKRILQTYDIPIVDFITLKENDTYTFEDISQKLGNPVFIKSAEQGSSIGVYKVRTALEYNDALKKCFQYGEKLIIEKNIHGREIECAILGNHNPKISILGEVIPSENHDFYTYDAKYMDHEGAKLIIDASIDINTKNKIQSYAKKAFKILDCKGLARIDFFLTHDDKIYLNEINTMPGFTNMSMYPKLFMHEGISYQDLITTLITFSFETFSKTQSYMKV